DRCGARPGTGQGPAAVRTAILDGRGGPPAPRRAGRYAIPALSERRRDRPGRLSMRHSTARTLRVSSCGKGERMGILAGQVALVTGAGRGFGRAIAERLASEGARVALMARSIEQLEDVAAAIRQAGGEAVAVRCDLSSPSDIAQAVTTAESRLGPTDILISNAGVPGPFGPLWEVDPEKWWQA